MPPSPRGHPGTPIGAGGRGQPCSWPGLSDPIRIRWEWQRGQGQRMKGPGGVSGAGAAFGALTLPGLIKARLRAGSVPAHLHPPGADPNPGAPGSRSQPRSSRGPIPAPALLGADSNPGTPRIRSQSQCSQGFVPIPAFPGLIPIPALPGSAPSPWFPTRPHPRLSPLFPVTLCHPCASIVPAGTHPHFPNAAPECPRGSPSQAGSWGKG